MRVCDLINCPAGTRVRVTKVFIDNAEKMGYVEDSAVLTGRTGTVTGFYNHEIKQLHVRWDDPGTTLSLAGRDEIEILHAERAVDIAGASEEVAKNGIVAAMSASIDPHSTKRRLMTFLDDVPVRRTRHDQALHNLEEQLNA